MTKREKGKKLTGTKVPVKTKETPAIGKNEKPADLAEMARQMKAEVAEMSRRLLQSHDLPDLEEARKKHATELKAKILGDVKRKRKEGA